MLTGFLLALVLVVSLSDVLNYVLYRSLVGNTPLGALQTGGQTINYLQPDLLYSLLLFGGELVAVVFAVVISSGAILALKPKEILSKMS